MGDTFYAQVNSSVLIDKRDNLYYFVQEGKRRTLYKNRESLFSYEGYYGIVSDVDSLGRVYFIANSQRGSTLYRYGVEGVQRVSSADNIVEARLINDDEVFLAAVGKSSYYYLVNSLSVRDEMPFVMHLFFEDKSDFLETRTEQVVVSNSMLPKVEVPYYGPLSTEYAGTQLALGAVSKNSNLLFTYDISAAFIDPLLTNRYSVFLSKGYDEVGLVGAGYENSAHLLSFGASVYGVYSEGDAQTYHLYDAGDNNYTTAVSILKGSRNYGLSAFLSLPVVKSGYVQSNINLRYYQDYDNNARSPLVLSGDISRSERYFQAMENNYLNALSLFGAYDRSDLSLGAEYTLAHDLPQRFYLSSKIKGAYSDFDRDAGLLSSENYTRGVKFSNFSSDLFRDPATVVMPTLEYTRFVKQAVYGEVTLKKQFNATLLFFTFPLSLRREMFYLKHRYYDIEDFGQGSSWSNHTHYNESTVGLSLDVLVMNRLTVPLNLEYIHNDNTLEEHNFRVGLGEISF